MEDSIVAKIKYQFDTKGNPAKITLMSGKQFFEARAEEDGIYVDNLKNQPFLPWKIFSEAVNFLQENGGQAKKGNATNSRLGDPNLDLNTIEGYIASKVYGCKIGDSVFKRITPIASILAWAEICENTRGQICLLSDKKELHTAESKKDIPETDLPETEISFTPSGEEKKEKAEITSLYLQLSNRDTELNNLKIKLEESLQRIKEFEERFAGRDNELSRLREELEAGTGEIDALKKSLSDSEEKIKTLEDDLTKKDEAAKNLGNQFIQSGEAIKRLEGQITQNSSIIEGLKISLNEKNEAISILEKSISVKNKDLETLAGEVIAKSEEVKKIEAKLTGKERTINTVEAMRAASDEKIKKLEKQLSGYAGEEKLAGQLREKDELIKQIKGTLVSKEEEVSRLNDENRKYRMQQKYEAEGLKQIEEQKASKKWWNRR
ncbi:Chromosome segregation ATPase [Methanosarcina lacustris Z-7289]|uniref:Chromosome segregation ATPase n=1 Tax=Methanosarcina lacustris Z-7289 TaxID=1434111 RepID=A0A0E3WS00_9EURY|nr:hypothetical protein [Methanosarcina lacustris]AKB75985.1 Chromosome segregation ATPase [Methanosarcina lacustris Z-7289]